MDDLALMTLSYLLEGVSAAVLFQAFGSPRFSLFRERRLSAGLFWTLFWTAVNVVCYFVFDTESELNLLIKLAVLTASLFAASLAVLCGSVFERLFPAVLYTAVRELSLHAANCFTAVGSLAGNFLGELALDGKIPLDFFIFAIRSVSLLVNTVALLLRAGILYAVAKRIARYGRGCPRVQREGAICLLPAGTGIMISVLLRIQMLMIDDGIPTTIYSRFPALYAVVPIISFTLLASVAAGFRLYRDMSELRREQTEKQILQAQIAGLQQSISESERLHERDRAFRHDLKNNLYILGELLREKCPNDGEINRYFENLRLSSEETERRVKTGNAVCDAVVNGKFALIAREFPGIRLDADGFLLSDLGGIEAYDVGIVLSNALDNAAEACQRLREESPGETLFISVRSIRKKNMLLIETENSFGGVLRLGADGFPKTVKTDGGSHGIGLRSIRSCAEKYSGGLDFTAENGKFVLSVMMKFNRKE